MNFPKICETEILPQDVSLKISEIIHSLVNSFKIILNVFTKLLLKKHNIYIYIYPMKSRRNNLNMKVYNFSLFIF